MFFYILLLFCLCINIPTCIPSKANIRMKRKRRKRRERIERIELRREMTKFRSEDQYFVTLKILKSLRALSTESPNCPASGLENTMIFLF